MKTGFTAFKLALAGLLIPYIYVFHPMLLFVDVSFWPLCQAIVSAFIGIFLLSMFTIGYFKAPLAWPLRWLALVGALGLLHPKQPPTSWGWAIPGCHLRSPACQKQKAGCPFLTLKSGVRHEVQVSIFDLGM